MTSECDPDANAESEYRNIVEVANPVGGFHSWRASRFCGQVIEAILSTITSAIMMTSTSDHVPGYTTGHENLLSESIRGPISHAEPQRTQSRAIRRMFRLLSANSASLRVIDWSD